MKPSDSLRRLCAGLALALSPFAHAADSTGTVRGQVSNAATGAFLEGARVEVRGTDRIAFTDRQGHFLLTVPAGSATLDASYTGLEKQSSTLDLAAGREVVRHFALTSAVYQLEAFTVAGVREGNARAVTLQRGASNVKNVAATDTFGNIANGNIGEFLQRLPGLSPEFNGSEINGVSIRGIGSALNSVTLDGDRVATSASANTGRAFEFEQTSLNLIETVEVTKAPTPDMDADSIGGAVNMVTKGAFDRADPNYFTYALGFSHRWGRRAQADSWTKEPIDGLMPSLNFTWSRVVGEKKNIGVLLTGTWHVQATADLRTTMLHQQALARPAYVYSVTTPELIGSPRARLALGAKVDYKVNANTVVTLNTFYNWMHDSQFTQQRQLSTSQAIATFDANGNRTGTGTIRPGFTDTFAEVLTSTNSLSTLTVTTVDKTGATWGLKPSAKLTLDGGRLLIDANANWSYSRTKYDAAPTGRDYEDQPKGTVTATLRNLGWTVDRSRSLTFPLIRQTAGPDLTNLANYSGLQLTQPDRSGDDTVIGARLNAKRSLDLAVPAFVKFGANYRRQERELENTSRRYNWVSAASIGPFLNTSGRYDEIVDAYKDEVGFHLPSPFPDPYAVAQDVRDRPANWTEDITYRYTQYFQNRRSMTESIGGAYAMAEARLRRLTLLGGVRLEETRTSGSGPLRALTPAEVARRAAWVGTVTPAEAQRRVEAEYTGRLANSAKYRNTFPGAHAKYELPGGLVARASYSTGIGRPDFGSIMPNSDVNFTTQRITISNPALKPQRSKNYDVSLEYYFEPVGLFSVGAFRKDIRDYIFQDSSQTVPTGANNGFDGQYGGYTIVTSANGGSAKYRGIEASYQQQFTFLPGVWRNLGLIANYTRLKTEGNYGSPTTTTAVAGFIPRMMNVALSYRGKRASVIVQRNWTSTYLVTNSTNAALVRYQAPREVFDVKTKYTLTRAVSLFCDVENVFAEPINQNYFVFEDRPNQTRLTVQKVVFGVQGRF
ncbi:MAG: TonB-dependent receptor [Opitutaceae bacterium]|nr:TonB-dependent receptor [Opitutaceae bacterium]